MKPGDLVQRHSSLSLFNHELTIAYEEALNFNRKINIIWAFATNRETPPPYTSIVVPPNVPCLLLDSRCDEFYSWVQKSRFEDPRNILSAPIVKLLCNGEVIITLAKWIEPVQKRNYFRSGEL
jgi:hypothetical protein